MSNDSWQLSYDTYEAEKEGAREALLAVGNGVFGTRGCLEECDAGEVNYPGTYIAGVYNRLESQAGGRSVFNEDFVNCPNWLPLTFKIEGGEWLDLNRAELVEISRTLNLHNGVLDRRVVVRDEAGRETEVISRRTASMANPHVAALSYSVKPLNYSGQIVFRSGLDGDIINANVARYRDLSSRHLEPEKSGGEGAVSHIVVRTNQSGIQIAEVARLSVTQDGNAISPEFKSDEKPGAVLTEFAVDVGEGNVVMVEKVVGIRTSLDPEGGDSLEGAQAAVESVTTFDEIVADSEAAWADIWGRIDIAVEGDELSQKLLRLHLYHSMVTASPHTAALDVGIPARGLHGEAYRGHIFWD
ncbi:MAG: beta-phosphoglucomutase, partial [Verrucomicrobia bacterium]|nr:beta-phosphoglucomutase [Verrucomicrobiota bacterium]